MNWTVTINHGLVSSLLIPRAVSVRLVAAILNDVPVRFARPGYTDRARVPGRPSLYQSNVVLHEGNLKYAFRVILGDLGDGLLVCEAVQLFGVW